MRALALACAAMIVALHAKAPDLKGDVTSNTRLAAKVSQMEAEMKRMHQVWIGLSASTKQRVLNDVQRARVATTAATSGAEALESNTLGESLSTSSKLGPPKLFNKAKCRMEGDAEKTEGVIGTLDCTDEAKACPDDLSAGTYLFFSYGGSANCLAFSNTIARSGSSVAVRACHAKRGLANKELCKKEWKDRVVTKVKISKLHRAGMNSIIVALKRVVCSDSENDGSKTCDTYKVGLCVDCPPSENPGGTIDGQKKNKGTDWFRNNLQGSATNDELEHAAKNCLSNALTKGGRVKADFACGNTTTAFQMSDAFMKAF